MPGRKAFAGQWSREVLGCVEHHRDDAFDFSSWVGEPGYIEAELLACPEQDLEKFGLVIDLLQQKYGLVAQKNVELCAWQSRMRKH